jgi:hypothetical protein
LRTKKGKFVRFSRENGTFRWIGQRRAIFLSPQRRNLDFFINRLVDTGTGASVAWDDGT